MPFDLILQHSPDLATLGERQARLAAVRAAIRNREGELEVARAELKGFEMRYLSQVGMLYAELDGWDARIAEREVDLYDSESARRRAREARQRARETHDEARRAAGGEDEEIIEVEAPSDLKRLFREVAKRIHPDLAGDEEEQKHLTLLMVRANQAYGRGDLEMLQRMLDDHTEVHASDGEEGYAAELLRVLRQIQHGERDLAALGKERERLQRSEIGQLFLEEKAAMGAGRNLLEELAAGLREQIAVAQRRFELVDLQVGAHGR